MNKNKKNNTRSLTQSITRDRRLQFMVGFIIIISISLLYRVYNVMFDPSYTIPAKAQWMAREPKTQQSLNIQLNKLNEISNNIDSYSIQEIKSALKNTALLVNLSNKELNSQYEAWLSIKGVMEKDRKVFDKIRNEINNVEGMKEKQVLAVQEIIERNKNENVIGSFFTGITTFFLGVISSILGTIILKKYNKQISNLFFR